MDRYLAGIVLWVLIICSLFLLDDLKVIELPFFNKTTHEDRKLVGQVELVRNQVKRRSQDEFLWSGTKQSENIYFYDSILTLSESQVRLELFGKSKIDLSENTLILIEPSLNGNREEIRLKFKRGSLKSKDITQSTQIQAGEWEFKLEPGTDFNLRSNDNDTFELEIQKGSAKVSSSGQEKTITSDEALILNPKSLEILNLNTQLDWEGPAFKRIYTYDKASTVTLDWKGKAKVVAHSQKNNASTTVDLSETIQTYSAELPLGSHFFRLKDGSASSKLLTVELVRAPSVHLYSPLPRDRVEYTKPVNFTWRKVSELSKYRLEIARDSEFKFLFKSFETANSNFEYKPEEQGRFYWRIVGIDNEGFEALPAYSNEILFIENPLGAPGLERPERKPSDQNSKWIPRSFWLYSLINLFISVAHAEEPPITLEWKKVNNADTYTLEIDDDQYFQSPEIITTTKNTYFHWTKNQKGVVYWRVAGDSKKGRLGLFSPVQKSDLSKLKFSRMPSGDFDIYIKDVSKTPVVPLQPVVASEYPPPVKEEPVIVVEPLTYTPLTYTRGYFSYGFGYGYDLIKTKDIQQVTLVGMHPINFSGDYNFHSEAYSIKVKADVSYISWKRDVKKYPFQEDQEVVTGSLAAYHSSRARELWFGFKVAQKFEPKRVAMESMELVPLYLLGPSLQFDALISETVINHLSSSLLFGSSTYLLDIDNTVRKRQMITSTSAFSIGLKTSIAVFSIKDATGMSYSGQAQIVLGFDW